MFRNSKYLHVSNSNQKGDLFFEKYRRLNAIHFKQKWIYMYFDVIGRDQINDVCL